MARVEEMSMIHFKPDGRILLEKPNRGREENIYVTVICEGAKYIHLAQFRQQRRALICVTIKIISRNKQEKTS